MKLRPTIIEQIYNELNLGHFCQNDFLIEFNANNTLVDICFRGNKKYRFYIHETYSRQGIFSIMRMLNCDAREIIESYQEPGEYNISQHVRHDNFNSAVGDISKWTMRIREDIIAQRFFSAPHADDLIELFQKQIDESVKDEEEYFTKEEESKLSQKLEALQKRVSELEEKYNLEKEKANEVKDAISSSKSDINIYPKGIWYRTSANKIINALKLAFKNKEVKAMLLEVTKEYILKMIGINK